jgi:hypothetical protein
VEISIPEGGEIVKMTGVVKKVEVEKMRLTFRADKEKKIVRVRGAKSILETLKPGDRIIISVSDNSIKYIRKVETIEKEKKQGKSSTPDAAPREKAPAAEKAPAPENPPTGKP